MLFITSMISLPVIFRKTFSFDLQEYFGQNHFKSTTFQNYLQLQDSVQIKGRSVSQTFRASISNVQ